jgi:hypothetical protein
VGLSYHKNTDLSRDCREVAEISADLTKDKKHRAHEALGENILFFHFPAVTHP